MPKRQDIPDCKCGGRALLASTNIGMPVMHRIQCALCSQSSPWYTRPSRAYGAWRKGARCEKGASTVTLQVPGEIGASKWDGATEDEVTAEILRGLIHQMDFAAVPILNRDEAAGWWFSNRIVGKGNTPSQPDLWLRKHTWPAGVWLAIEIKGREGSPRYEGGQEILRDRCGIRVCQSFEAVVEAIEQFEGALNV